MTWLALLFLALFTGFFVRETLVSLRPGRVSSRGVAHDRQMQPIRFWIGIAAWVLNATLGALFFVLLGLSKLG